MLKAAIKRPTALQKGDRVRVVAPASPFDENGLRRGLEVIERLGYRPIVDKRVFRQKCFLAGSDGHRAEQLEQALLEEDTSAVWCIRGGYGSARLLPRLELKALKGRSKVLVGFSDLTALLLALSSPGGYVTFHGPVVMQLPSMSRACLHWFTKLVERPLASGEVPLGRLKTVVNGRVSGFLSGGNLSVLTSLVGTPFFPSLAGSILFIEDTGEQAYRLDRMFWQLREAGVLENVFGVVIGSLSGCKPVGRAAHSARRIIEQAVFQLGVPAVSGASFGHIARNVTLPMGVLARLDATKGRLTILEPSVREAYSRV